MVRRACKTASDEDFSALQHLIEDQAIAAKRNDLRRLFELDEEFHRAIHRAAGLLAVADELEDVKVHLNRLRFVSVSWPRGADKITGEHEAILSALRARDEERAAAAMTAHLRAVLPVLERLAAGDGEQTQTRAVISYITPKGLERFLACSCRCGWRPPPGSPSAPLRAPA